MGVPKFYRWISERYPCLSEVVREYQIPEFDNLYLDMNGIIHNCSHPNDEDVHFRISEEKIFQDIFRYIEFLFRMIKPRKVFFMAIDGVAPRAKMNQQRGRRFRSAKEAETRENEAKQRGETLPDEKRFDSNCITPGTEFMDRLHQHLKYFVSNKITSDDLWRDVKVILSGHETPGEGEHKIMDFIRFEKSGPNYDPNTRHCLYGLDADLIMLGMCSHEPHFSLLREEVKYIRSKTEKNKRDSNPEAITFHLFHLSLFREYIEHEFEELKTTLKFGFNLENIIDDWVLMGFLVGNDFIPHIPHFHINKSSLLKLYSVYKKVLPTLDGYLNENGNLNLRRFQKYINELKHIDIDNFSDFYADFKHLESKTGRKLFKRDLNEAGVSEAGRECAPIPNVSEHMARKGIKKLINIENSDDNESYNSDDVYDSDSDKSLILDEFKAHKRDYYMNKLNYPTMNDSVLKEQSYEYIRAIQWNLHYYYNGCMSWGWYYPHHYAPFISDVNGFDDIDLNFEFGEPFKPFEQLLAVLPSASKDLLPKAYESLVSNPDSQLIDYYPEEFETDMNEKQQAWEAVVLIPFIEEKRLLRAVEGLKRNLSSDEKRRNRHGPHLVFTYSDVPLEPIPSPNPSIFPEIPNRAKCVELHMDGFRIPIEGIQKGLCNGVQLDVYFPGFPTLQHIPHEVVIKKERVRVFESASMGENMMLIMKNEESVDFEEVAQTYLNKTVFVNWPHLLEAQVFKVSNGEYKYYTNNNTLLCEEVEEKEFLETDALVNSKVRRYKERWGVVVGQTQIVLHVFPMTGRKYVHGSKGRVTLEKIWSTVPMVCPLQTVVKELCIHDKQVQQFRTIDEIYPNGAKCFIIDNPYYGSEAEVIECITNEGVVRVQINPQLEPDLREIQERAKEIVHERYVPNRVMAGRLGISNHLLSRITGTIFIKPPNEEKRRINIGLNLKFNAKNEEIPGFSIKRDDIWLFSDKTYKILNEYITKFSYIFQSLASCTDKDFFTVEDLIPGDNKLKKLEEIQNWLRGLASTTEKHQKCNAEILDEFVVEAIEDIINTHIVFPKEMPSVVVTFRPDQLFRPIHYLGFSLPDPKAKYELFDRVVNIRSGISVPLGKKGTIIGKHLDEANEVNTLYDIVFDEEFIGGTTLRCSPGKGYKLSPANLINITYGLKMSGKYEQFISTGQPLQSGPQHFTHSQRHSHSRYPNHPFKYMNDFTFGQRMLRPRLPNNSSFFNQNSPNPQNPNSRPMQALNHSKNSPFQSPKHENQKNQEFPQIGSTLYTELWNNMSTLKMSDNSLSKGSFADITASKRQPEFGNQSTRHKESIDKNKSNSRVRTQKNVPESRKTENVVQTYGQNKSVKPRVELFDSFNKILNNYCERHNKPLPKFEQMTYGPMKSTSLKMTDFDANSFHTAINAHQSLADAYECLAKEALQKINDKYNANIDLTRPKKLLSLPSFADPNHQKSPNRPKIAESSLPRPPPNWTAKSPKQFVRQSDYEIPESFVEQNERIYNELQKEKRNSSSQANVNTSGNKDRNLQPKKLFDNRSDNLVNSTHNQRLNTNRNNRKIQNDSNNDHNSGQQRRHPQSSGNASGGQSAFKDIFVPLQVARNNQSHRHSTPLKNLAQRTDDPKKDLIEVNSVSSEEIEILSPETIAQFSSTSRDNSNDEIEILTPESLIASSAGGRRSRRQRLGVDLS